MYLNIKIEDRELLLINIYGPNEDNKNFCMEIADKASQLYNGSTIIGGDFNTVLDPLLDKKGGSIDHHAKCRETLQSIISDRDLVDIWRILNPNKQLFTWYRKKPSLIFSRLDHF